MHTHAVLVIQYRSIKKIVAHTLKLKLAPILIKKDKCSAVPVVAFNQSIQLQGLQQKLGMLSNKD